MTALPDNETLPTIQQVLRKQASHLNAHHANAATVMFDAANELDRLYGGGSICSGCGAAWSIASHVYGQTKCCPDCDHAEAALPCTETPTP